VVTSPKNTLLIMESLFSFLAQNRTGILVLFLILAGVAFVIQWFAWIFNWGRFRRGEGAITADEARRNSLRFIFADLLLKIINDFRHLLALIIVLIFAIALGVAMYIGDGSIDDFAKAMQAVVATLGGLVGSIIGYYFGESTVAKQQQDSTSTATTTEQEQEETPDDAENITPAPLPPADNPDADEDGSS